jgi:hypothetical protein
LLSTFFCFCSSFGFCSSLSIVSTVHFSKNSTFNYFWVF